MDDNFQWSDSNANQFNVIYISYVFIHIKLDNVLLVIPENKTNN